MSLIFILLVALHPHFAFFCSRLASIMAPFFLLSYHLFIIEGNESRQKMMWIFPNGKWENVYCASSRSRDEFIIFLKIDFLCPNNLKNRKEIKHIRMWIKHKTSPEHKNFPFAYHKIQYFIRYTSPQILLLSLLNVHNCHPDRKRNSSKQN